MRTLLICGFLDPYETYCPMCARSCLSFFQKHAVQKKGKPQWGGVTARPCAALPSVVCVEDSRRGPDGVGEPRRKRLEFPNSCGTAGDCICLRVESAGRR